MGYRRDINWVLAPANHTQNFGRSLFIYTIKPISCWISAGGSSLIYTLPSISGQISAGHWIGGSSWSANNRRNLGDDQLEPILNLCPDNPQKLAVDLCQIAGNAKNYLGFTKNLFIVCLCLSFVLVSWSLVMSYTYILGTITINCCDRSIYVVLVSRSSAQEPHDWLSNTCVYIWIHFYTNYAKGLICVDYLFA